MTTPRGKPDFDGRTVSKVSWLTPYYEEWQRQYPEGIVPVKELAQALKPLTLAFPPERITAELRAYLRNTLPRFVSVRRFVQTFGSWSRPEPRRPYSQTVDEMDRNAGLLP